MSESAIEGKESLKISIPKPQWEKVEDGKFSEDHVINAYLSGKESALREISDVISKQKIEFLEKGMDCADSLLETLKEKYEVNFEKVFLRQIEFKSIDVIIFIPSKVYFSDLMTKIYETTFEFEESVQDDLNMNVSYSFDLKEIDISKISHDGYFFSREP